MTRRNCTFQTSKKRVCHFRFTCRETSIQCTDCYKYLGVEFTEYLSWAKSVENTAISANKTASYLIANTPDVVEAHYFIVDIGLIWAELLVSRYVAESITTDAGHFGHVGLCQLHSKLKTLQCETSLIANTDQWCYVIVRGFVIAQGRWQVIGWLK